MAKSFEILRQKLPPRVRKRSEKKAQQLIQEMELQALRRMRHINQEDLAEALSTKQANISRLERREDMHVSTLRDYIEAMGGQLDIIARFPDGDVRIDQFD